MGGSTCAAPDCSASWISGVFSVKFAAVLVSILGLLPLATFLLGPKLVAIAGGWIGRYLQEKTAGRRAQILDLVDKDEEAWAKDVKDGRRDSEEWDTLEGYGEGKAGNEGKAQDDFDGIVGFFHPFCNAGGGGERVLWAAIRATQKRWPKAKCIVYTGDHDVDKAAILARVKNRFNIHLHPPTVAFLYLTTRSWVLASSWPHFTLIGQSIGSLVLVWDAFTLLTPDIFVDTMGYAFALGLSKLLFPNMPTGAYVHYPTISTDMLSSLDSKDTNGGQGAHAGKGVGTAGKVKKIYWELFAKLYSAVGATIDVVMTNSTWTNEHIMSLWGPWRKRSEKGSAITVYPPVAVEELEQEVEVSEESEKKREPALLYIAQFRPEKNHKLILSAFAAFVKTDSAASRPAKLILIGSVRDDGDAKRVYELRLLANELQIRERVEFHLDASWPEILDWLRRASVGVNGMWNEHFGIGVVEYQASGLISVVHDSAGPKKDIVVDVEGKPTGFHANKSAGFAAGFESALALKDKLPWRRRARISAKRFTEEEFAKGWIVAMEKLVDLRRSKT